VEYTYDLVGKILTGGPPLKLKLGCPVLDAFSRAGLLTLQFDWASAYGIDADQPGFLLRIERETTPRLILRMSDKFPLHRVHVHVVEFLDELGLTPDVEVVVAGLPELG
jgi:hypothetical protein